MLKKVYLCCIFLITSSVLQAQQKEFEWRLGFSAGYSNYYGDLSPYTIQGLSNLEAIHHLFYFNPTYSEKPSFKISLERQLSPTIGLMFSYAEYHFSMSDRYVQRDGRLMLENPNFFRSLNFQNHTRDMGLSFVFKTDNDRLLSSKSLIAPYFTLGLGLINFEVFGDLLDDEGMRYDYTLPIPVNNGVYETDLQPLKTEREDGYSLGSLYTNLGLGFRVRLGNRMELFAQSDFLYTFTDYLDDVSGNFRSSYDNDFQAYAANPSGMVLNPNNPQRGNINSPNDWIIFHSIGLKFNFGASKKTFSAPRLSSFQPGYVNPVATPSPKVPELPEEDINEDRATTNNYYNIQILDEERLNSLEYKTQMLRWEQQILEREKLILQGQRNQDELITLRSQFLKHLEALEQDESLDSEEKERMLDSSRNRLFNPRYSIDSTSRRESEIRTEIDSLRNLLEGGWEGQATRAFTQDSIEIFFRERVLTEMSMTEEALQDEQIIEETSEIKEREPFVKRDTVVIVQQTANSSKTEPEESKALVQQEETQAKEEVRTEQSQRASTTIGYDDDERIRSLQEEVDYLRYQRNQLLLDQRAQEQDRSEPQETIIRERIVEQSEGRQEGGTEEESGRKNRWWWPFGAGAAAGTIASSNKDETEQSEAMSTTEIFLSQAEIDRIGIAVSSAFLGTSFISSDAGSKDKEQVIEEKSSPTPQLKEEKPEGKETMVSAIEEIPEVIRDTVYVENEPVVRMLKSKEIIYFQVNQREPDETELRKLANLAEYVKEHPSTILVLTGFADNTGSVNYNLRLAEDRTNSVAEALKESFGLDSDQIHIESGGQVVRGTQRIANERDRRVEVKVETRER
jgi:outer membrane protein OmpA-like peptidoglycan-associated protein